MLTEYMGGSLSNIEFNSDSSERSIEDRRLSPAALFKKKFSQLLEGMRAGDVRFLYLDGPRTMHPGMDGYFGDPYVVISDDEGGEIITCDWISQAIRAVSNNIRAPPGHSKDANQF